MPKAQPNSIIMLNILLSLFKGEMSSKEFRAEVESYKKGINFYTTFIRVAEEKGIIMRNKKVIAYKSAVRPNLKQVDQLLSLTAARLKDYRDNWKAKKESVKAPKQAVPAVQAKLAMTVEELEREIVSLKRQFEEGNKMDLSMSISITKTITL